MKELSWTVYDSLNSVFHDTVIELKNNQKATLEAPRGGCASFQIVCVADTLRPQITIKAIPLNREQGIEKIEEIEIKRVLFVPVEENTAWEWNWDSPDKELCTQRNLERNFTDKELDPRMAPHVLRAAPFSIAEVLAPQQLAEPEENRPTVFYVNYKIPRDIQPGLYSGKVNIYYEGEKISVPVSLTVWSISLLEKQQLMVSNWFHLKNIAEQHKLKMWSEPYWEMLRKYAQLVRNYGQNVFWITDEILEPKVNGGRVILNFERLDRYVNIFLEEGFEMIEGPFMAKRKSLRELGTYIVGGHEFNAQDACFEAQDYLYKYFTQLWQYIQKKGWNERWYNHVADEPQPEESKAYFRLCNIARKLMPGVKLIEAIPSREELIGALDVAIPILSIDKEIDKFIQATAIGSNLWIYTCCGPRGPFLNRFLDFALIKTRLIHWINFRKKATGYLHWGLNSYGPGQNPFKRTVTTTIGEEKSRNLPPGDTHIVYPGKDGPWPSLRFAAMRDGIQDYELLQFLTHDKEKKGQVEKLAQKVVPHTNDYMKDIKKFRAALHYLLQLGEY